MRRLTALALTAALSASGLLGSTAFAESGTANAIISEGNGAAVFIGYGGDREIDLSWRPSRTYDAATLIYQVQRSDGPMLESKKQSTHFVDRNLQPNTSYTYTLRVYQLVEKTTRVKGQTITKTITKAIGKNSITVMTYPAMVQEAKFIATNPVYVPGASFTGTCTASLKVTWKVPQNNELNATTFAVYWGGNLQARGLTATEFVLDGLQPGATQSGQVWIYTENATGIGTEIAKLSEPKYSINNSTKTCSIVG